MAERRLDVLVVRWYERQDRSPDIVGRWLRAAREHLPEAVPRRFGDSEPLRGRFERDGEAGLTNAYAAADQLSSSPAPRRSSTRRSPLEQHVVPAAPRSTSWTSSWPPTTHGSAGSPWP